MHEGLLTRLEGLYLNILRGVIIVLATLMLAGAVIGAVIAGPMLLTSFSSDRSAERMVRGDDLQGFLRGDTSSQTGAYDTAEQAEIEERAAEADRRLREASRNFAQYIQARSGQSIVQSALTDYLDGKTMELSADLQNPYMDSVLELSRDLTRRSAGEPAVDVDTLIEWHHARFVSAMMEASEQNAQRALEATMRRTTAVAAAALAATAFGLFLLMVFVFVLVKIERNLRLVAVRVSDDVGLRPSQRV